MSNRGRSAQDDPSPGGAHVAERRPAREHDHPSTGPFAVTAITYCYLTGPVPIDIEQFESRDEEALRAGGPTNAEVILAFLAANDDQAFTP